MTSDERRRTGPIRPLFSLAEAATVSGARIEPGADACARAEKVAITGVEVDSRHVRPGDLFCALPGERVDGHSFVGRAFASGAVAALVSRDPGLRPPPDRALLYVGDTLKGLADLARHHRDRFGLPVLAVTGSVGKTTTKDLIASALGAALTVLANPGNLNTDIGLPLTLFELGPEHQVACLEMGMRGPGEIARLAGLARPTAGVITNVGPVHVELLGSVEAIARAKEELLWALPPGGAAILNADDAIVAGMAGRHRGRLATIVTYGLDPSADVGATDLEADPSGEITTFRVHVAGADLGIFSVPLAGRHSVSDALAAVAAGLHFGLDPEAIKRGLASPRLSAMRQEVISVAGVRVINDAYNAGPASMAASVDFLVSAGKARSGKTIAILGDMLELGQLSEKAHRDLGRLVAAAGVDYLATVGPRSAALAEEAVRAGLELGRVRHFGAGPVEGENGRPGGAGSPNAAAAAWALGLVGPGDTILVKASRGMKFEEIAGRLVEGLRRNESAGAAPRRGRGGVRR